MLGKTINRPSLLSWSPKFKENSLVACGTFSQKVSKNSQHNSKLEIFDLSTSVPVEQMSIEVPSSFNRLLWTSVEANIKDLIIGAFEDGRLEIYDAELLLNAKPDAIVESPKLHSGPIKGLCVSGFQPNLIATGASDGEIALWDLDNIHKAALINVKKSDKFTDASDIAWNQKVAHIIAAASDSGILSIIDLRAKKEVTSIKTPGNCCISAISWSPETATNIVTASGDDSQPFAFLWDLRVLNSPKNVQNKNAMLTNFLQTFSGHSKGLSSLSWCPKDPKMILSGGKDGKILCWNPESNDIVKEYSESNVIDIQWCPTDPNFFCSSSEDGINFHSINDTFFEHQDNSQQLPKLSPKWLSCPIGASFGGSGICATFRQNSHNISLIKPKIDQFETVHATILDFEGKIKQGCLQQAVDNIFENEENEELQMIGTLLRYVLFSKSSDEFLTIVYSIKLRSFNIKPSHENLNSFDDGNILKPDDLIHINEHLTEKIMSSDHDSAVIHCLEKNLFTEALVISNCGGNELRMRTEDYILKKRRSFPLLLATSIRNQNFEELIISIPIQDWLIALEALCRHAHHDSIPGLCKLLYDRLIDSNLFEYAIYVAALSKDLELFINLALKHINCELVTGDLNTDDLHNVIRAYKIIRLIGLIEPNFIKNIKDSKVKSLIFGISTKVKYLFLSFGFDKNIVVDFLDSEFYNNNMKNKSPELDSFKETFSNCNISGQNLQDHDLPNNLHKTVFNPNSMTSFIPEPFAPIPGVHVKKIDSPTLNGNYNDAPIINPKLSKFSPRVDIHEIKIDDIKLALQTLLKSIEAKDVKAPTSRIVKDCFEKLKPELIYLKEYSNLSKPAIYTLFKEISSGNFESSGILAANILASFFVETKEWILPLKRLIEIAKNQ